MTGAPDRCAAESRKRPPVLGYSRMLADRKEYDARPRDDKNVFVRGVAFATEEWGLLRETVANLHQSIGHADGQRAGGVHDRAY